MRLVNLESMKGIKVLRSELPGIKAPATFQGWDSGGGLLPSWGLGFLACRTVRTLSCKRVWVSGREVNCFRGASFLLSRQTVGAH